MKEDEKKYDDYYAKICDYFNSVKEAKSKDNNKMYLIDKETYKDFRGLLHLDELKLYLEKVQSKLNPEDIKKFFEEKKIEIKNFVKDCIITEKNEKDGKADNNKEKEEIDENFKKLLNFFGIKDTQKPKDEELNKNEENKGDNKNKAEEEIQKELNKNKENTEVKKEEEIKNEDKLNEAKEGLKKETGNENEADKEQKNDKTEYQKQENESQIVNDSKEKEVNNNNENQTENPAQPTNSNEIKSKSDKEENSAQNTEEQQQLKKEKSNEKNSISQSLKNQESDMKVKSLSLEESDQNSSIKLSDIKEEKNKDGKSDDKMIKKEIKGKKDENDKNNKISITEPKDRILLNQKTERNEDKNDSEKLVDFKKMKKEEISTNEANPQDQQSKKEAKSEDQGKNEIIIIPKQEEKKNEGVNMPTPEQMQQMYMMMVQNYLFTHGSENSFINNYSNLIYTQTNEPDPQLPQVVNGRIKLFPNEPSLGLQNVGATCYMNATLECLIHIKELSELLLSAFLLNYPRYNDKYNSTHKLSNAYITLLSNVFFPKLNGNTQKYFAPYEIKQLISEINPLFQGIQANDAKDLLQCLLENLHNELKMSTQYFQEYRFDQKNELQTFQYFYNSFITQNKSPILDILYGLNKIESTCLNCKKTIYNFQSYNLLYFPLKEAKRVAVLNKKKEDKNFDEEKYILNLEDCFAHNEQIEHFSGDNKMYCNECKDLYDADYQSMLYTTPTVMSIVLNRGKNNLDFQEEFDFGLDLDIKKYIHNEGFKHGKYYLIGMVVHSGDSSMSGHFIAYCRMDKNSKWFCYNDAWVSECDNIEEKLKKNSPYILFYHYDTDYKVEEEERKKMRKKKKKKLKKKKNWKN